MAYKLIHGDCFEEMQQMINKGIKYDLILTDPPYNILRNTKYILNLWDTPHTQLKKAQQWDSTEFNIEKYLQLCSNLLKPAGRLIIFSSGRFTVQLYQAMESIKQLKYSDDIIWIKNNHSNPWAINQRLANSTENITIFTKQGNGNVTFNKLPFQNINKNWFMIKKESKSYHTSQKPVKLLKNLIYIYSNKGDNILDPTSGSGSTIIAGLKLGRNVTGIEKEKEYCNITLQRINELKQHEKK